MNMRRLHLILFLSFALFACKKKDEDFQPCDYLQDLTAYSFFKKGTYWVYKDSATSAQDCVFVYFDTVYSYHHKGNPLVKEGDYNFWDCRAHSSFDGYNYYYQIDMGFYGSNGVIGTWRKRTKPTNYVGTTFLMSNIFEEGSYIGAYTSPGGIYCRGFSQHFNMHSTNFYTVVKFEDTKNASEFSCRTFFYIGKNIGIVRKEIVDSNKVWNLIRYKIVQ